MLRKWSEEGENKCSEDGRKTFRNCPEDGRQMLRNCSKHCRESVLRMARTFLENGQMLKDVSGEESELAQNSVKNGQERFRRMVRNA